jgi:hypothetical protein
VLADESVASRHLANPVYSAKVNYPKLATGYPGLTGVGVKTVRFGNTMGLFHVDFEETVADCTPRGVRSASSHTAPDGHPPTQAVEGQPPRGPSL